MVAPKASPRMPAEKRKEEIVQAAKRTFARKGYRSTSIADIVAQSSVGRGTFYLHFDSKREIFIHIIESYFDGLVSLLDQNHKAMERALAEGGNTMAVWVENLYRMLVYHQQDPELSRVIYREALGMDADFSNRVMKLDSHVRKMMRDELQMMLDMGGMRDCDVPLTASILYSSVAGIIMEYIVDHEEVDVAYLCNSLFAHHARALMPVGLDADEVLKTADVFVGSDGRLGKPPGEGGATS
jgi:AcrR family transcriptional regulator